MLTLTGGNLDGARVDAVLSFPGEIKEAFSNWRDGFPATSIDDRDVEVVQGSSGNSTVKAMLRQAVGPVGAPSALCADNCRTQSYAS